MENPNTPQAPTSRSTQPTQTVQMPQKLPPSCFTGNSVVLRLWKIAIFLGTICSLCLAYPWLRCAYERWIRSHTYVHGCRYKFDGTGGQLFGKYILWCFLSLITLGIYTLWLGVKMQKWLVQHTHFAGTQGGVSQFDAGLLSLWGMRFVKRFVMIITLFLGWGWAQCYEQRWIAKHTLIDGYQTRFDGRAIQFLGKFLLWVLLCVCTVGVYFLFLEGSKRKWIAKHTVCPTLVQSTFFEKICVKYPA